MNSLPTDFERPLFDMEQKIAEFKEMSQSSGMDMSKEIQMLAERLEELKNSIYKNLTPWQKVQIARHSKRPNTKFYIENIFTDFIELHGDRSFKDDKAIIAGIAVLNGIPVTVIGHQKGIDIKDNVERNFGMPHPEGYRKALRLMKQAEKFNRPIITFIDTPGAYCGIGAEERGQGEAIAANLIEMAALKVPVIAVVIGEGGSGGALALGVADHIIMLEHSIYSILSPEGFAAILWKDAKRAQEAAEVMKLTAQDLLELKVIDEIIEEPLGGAHNDGAKTALDVKAALSKGLNNLMSLDKEQLLNQRYEKYRKMGSENFLG